MSMFKTPQGQARYFAAYDATLSLWPVSISVADLPTQYGTTHVNYCGPAGAPPLVLLPGAAISSTMWYPNIAALSRAHRVFALDIVGDMGKSVSTRPMKKPADSMIWLNEVLDGLSLDRVDIAGISLGGFLALELAKTNPQRVRKLILLSPATLQPIHPLFYLRIAAAVLIPFLSSERRQRLFLGNASANSEPMIRQLLTPNDFRYQMFLPPAHKPEDLRQVQAPTLLLVGEREVIYAPHAAVARANKYMPHLRAEIIPGAGHALSLDQPEIVNQRIVEFLEKDF